MLDVRTSELMVAKSLIQWKILKITSGGSCVSCENCIGLVVSDLASEPGVRLKQIQIWALPSFEDLINDDLNRFFHR